MEKIEEQQKDINKIKEILKKYVSKATLISLKKYPGPPTKDALKAGKTAGAEFVNKYFDGCVTGCYFAWEKKFLLTDDKLIAIEKLVEDFAKHLIEDDYHGMGNILQRLSTMRSKPGVAKPSPVALKRHDEDLTIDDFVVFCVPIPDATIKTELETLCHKYNETYSEHKKRFKLYEYSSSNGSSGTKAYSLEHQIMSFADLKFEDGWKAFENLEEIKRRALGRFVANTTGSTPFSTQMKTITTEADGTI